MNIENFYKYKYFLKSLENKLDDVKTLKELNTIINQLRETELGFKYNINEEVYVWGLSGIHAYIYVKSESQKIIGVSYFYKLGQEKKLIIKDESIQKIILPMRKFPSNYKPCVERMENLLKLLNSEIEIEIGSKIYEVEGVLFRIYKQISILKKELYDKDLDIKDIIGEKLFVHLKNINSSELIRREIERGLNQLGENTSTDYIFEVIGKINDKTNINLHTKFLIYNDEIYELDMNKNKLRRDNHGDY